MREIDGSGYEDDYVCALEQWRGQRATTKLDVEGKMVNFLLDTGATCCVVPVDLVPPHRAIDKSKQPKISAYNGESIEVVGMVKLKVFNPRTRERYALRTYVVRDGRPVLGLSACEQMGLLTVHRHRIAALGSEKKEALLSEYNDLFGDDLGELRGYTARLELKEDAKPVFTRARPVPLAMQQEVADKIHEMERLGVWRRVKTSNYASPLVVVPKAKGLRLCADFKSTINPQLKVDQYPMPEPQDIFAQMSGKRVFSVLDFKRYFEQIKVADTEEMLTVNTPRGLFRYNRLPYGVASAPAIAQEISERLIGGMKNVHAFIDDLLIASETMEDHIATLRELFQRLRKAGVKLNREKCVLMKESVHYLGHVVSAQGLSTNSDKVRAVAEMPRPKNMSETKAFMGMVNYYAKFIKNLAETAKPLYELMRQDSVFKWTAECDGAFLRLKKELSEAPVLAHYSLKAPIRLACDASTSGIGATLSTVDDDGTERPITFASRTLSPAEQRYAQIDKEALSLVFGVKKFERYLRGREFELLTDHGPLTHIFGSKERIPAMAAARIVRWALFLSPFNYKIRYKPGAEHANADALSRLPLPDEGKDAHAEEAREFYVYQLEVTKPLTGSDIARETAVDETLKLIMERVCTGVWPKDDPDERTKMFNRSKDVLSVHDETLFYGRRIVVPHKLRERVLSTLHDHHPGMVRMKALARMHVWWPGIEADVESKVAACEDCQQQQPMPAQDTTPWPATTRPGERVHVDYAGPVNGKWLLVWVDTYSKWIEVGVTSHANAEETVQFMRAFSARWGLPETVVSDNGTPFVSQTFQRFCQENGITHLRAPPYHPQSNGSAERAVREVKKALARHGTGNIQLAVSNFLLGQHATPVGNGPSPANKMLGRELATRLTRLRGKDPMAEQRPTPEEPTDPVWIREYGSGRPKWAAATVDPRSAGAATMAAHRVGGGPPVHRHRDQVRRRRAPVRLDL